MATNPGDSTSSADKASSPPTPATTSLDDYYSLLTVQHATGADFIAEINRIVAADGDVNIGVDVVYYMYLKGKDGKIRRMALGEDASTAREELTAAEVAAAVPGVKSWSEGKPVFATVEIPQTRKATAILADWAPPTTCVVMDIVDMFNDKLGYAFKSYADAERLVPGMMTIARKFEFFGDTPPARKALHAFWTNYEAVNRGLRHLLALLRGQGPAVDMAAVGKDVTSMNAIITKLMTAGVRMKPRAPKWSIMTDAGVPKDVATSALEILAAFMVTKGLKPSTDVKLLYDAARDGMTAAKYHERVDGKSRVLMLMCGSGYWFGAFLPTALTAAVHGSYTTDANACLMTITNPYAVKATVFPVSNASQAYYTQNDYGPAFGAGHDLYIFGSAGSSYCNFPNSFSDTIGHGSVIFTGAPRGWSTSQIVVVQI